MDFSTSVFVYHLHAVRPYPRFSALHAACCFTRSQDLTRASALYTQFAALPALQRLTRNKVALHARRALHVRRTLHGASRLHPIHQPSHSFIERPRFYMAQLCYTLQHLIGMTVVVHPSNDIVYS